MENELVIRSGLKSSADITLPIKIVTTNYTVQDDDYTLVVSGSSKLTVTLPDPTNFEGKVYSIKNLSNVAVIDTIASGSKPIDRDTVAVIDYMDDITVQSISSRWVIIGRSGTSGSSGSSGSSGTSGSSGSSGTSGSSGSSGTSGSSGSSGTSGSSGSSGSSGTSGSSGSSGTSGLVGGVKYSYVGTATNIQNNGGNLHYNTSTNTVSISARDTQGNTLSDWILSFDDNNKGVFSVINSEGSDVVIGEVNSSVTLLIGSPGAYTFTLSTSVESWSPSQGDILTVDFSKTGPSGNSGSSGSSGTSGSSGSSGSSGTSGSSGSSGSSGTSGSSGSSGSSGTSGSSGSSGSLSLIHISEPTRPY